VVVEEGKASIEIPEVAASGFFMSMLATFNLPTKLQNLLDTTKPKSIKVLY
jgi:hypothetical protein